MLIANWTAWIYDVKGAFMNGLFEDGKDMYVEVTWRMEHHYWKMALLKLLKQAAILFWQKPLDIMKNMDMSKEDPWMYFSMNENSMFAIILSWVDNNLVLVNCML